MERWARQCFNYLPKGKYTTTQLIGDTGRKEDTGIKPKIPKLSPHKSSGKNDWCLVTDLQDISHFLLKLLILNRGLDKDTCFLGPAFNKCGAYWFRSTK